MRRRPTYIQQTTYKMNPFLIVLIVITTFVLVHVIAKLFLYFTNGWDRSPTCLVGKTTLVTGANTGIGFRTAEDFAKRGARVIMACRDPHKGEQAKKRIVEATDNTNIVVKVLDLSSLDSVRKFANDIQATESRLDVLVNNAGAGGFDYTVTEDGMSLLMQSNHFGPFLLTILLIGLIKKSAPSRIVMVSSAVSYFAYFDLSNLNRNPGVPFKKLFHYTTSKICNVLFANELARRLKGTGVDVNSVHPGVIYTDFWRHMTNPLLRGVFVFYLRLLHKTVECGAQTTIYVAVSKEVVGVSGKFFADCRRFPMPPRGGNLEIMKKVWDVSEKCVKLTPEEKQLLAV